MTLPAARPLRPSLPLAALACLLAACGGGGGGGPSPDPTFTITLRFCSALDFAHCTSDPGNATELELPSSQREIYRRAADRMEKVVAAGLVPARTRDSDGPLTCWRDERHRSGVRLDETVHGLLVLVVADDLGGGGTLASSGPCVVRSKSALPLVAVMMFNDRTGTDNASTLAEDGRLETVAFHELFHTLGFGTVWTDDSFDLVSGTAGDPRYAGKQALAQAKAQNGAPASWTSIPLDDTGLEGTGSSHWRQSVFASAAGYELMCGVVAPPGMPNPLSATSIGALADLGYGVDYAQAILPPFQIPHPEAAARALLAPSGSLPIGDDVLRVPVAVAGE